MEELIPLFTRSSELRIVVLLDLLVDEPPGTGTAVVISAWRRGHRELLAPRLACQCRCASVASVLWSLRHGGPAVRTCCRSSHDFLGVTRLLGDLRADGAAHPQAQALN
jgi:hypothetical protein